MNSKFLEIYNSKTLVVREGTHEVVLCELSLMASIPDGSDNYSHDFWPSSKSLKKADAIIWIMEDMKVEMPIVCPATNGLSLIFLHGSETLAIDCFDFDDGFVTETRLECSRVVKVNPLFWSPLDTVESRIRKVLQDWLDAGLIKSI